MNRWNFSMTSADTSKAKRPKFARRRRTSTDFESALRESSEKLSSEQENYEIQDFPYSDWPNSSLTPHLPWRCATVFSSDTFDIHTLTHSVSQ